MAWKMVVRTMTHVSRQGVWWEVHHQITYLKSTLSSGTMGQVEELYDKLTREECQSLVTLLAEAYLPGDPYTPGGSVFENSLFD